MSIAEQKRREKIEDKKKKLIWQTALYDASVQNGEFRLAWSCLKFIDPGIYSFHSSFGIHLRSVRLIGIELQELPEEFCTSLPRLELLCIENNFLITLPDSLTTMTFLRELSLMNNKLESLPERIGYLCSLEKIALNNNRIKSLPVTFGALNKIERLDLECNQISVLPENLDNMTLCRAVNVNKNKLTRLPRCIGRMPSLTQFSASSNQVTYLPQEFCTSATLTHLRLSKNLINAMPERMGDLQQLIELCLEYNKISRLPLSFYKLQRLKVLRLDGNTALLDPPPEVLTEGARRVVKYCYENYMSNKQGRMRHIILLTQNVLQQIIDRGVYNKALFEPEVRLGNGEDLWVGMQPTHFWDDLIPRMNQIWEALLRRSENSPDIVTSFTFSEQEFMWAWSNYADAYGPVLKMEMTKFRRCACVDSSTGEPMPCVPPEVGYLCYRQCFLFKRQLVRTRDRQERIWNAYKASGLEDAIKRAEHEAKLYLQSNEGKKWLDDTAYEQADEQLVDTGVSAVVQRRIDRAEAHKKKVITKFETQKKAIEKVRDEKLNTIQNELAKLKETRKLIREGYMRDMLEKRINECMVDLANLPENLALQQLNRQCEEMVEVIDEQLYTSSDSSFDSNQSSEFSSEDSSEEAQRYRKRRDRHYARKKDEERLKSLTDRFRPADNRKEEESSGALYEIKKLASAVKKTLQPLQRRMSAYSHKKVKKAKKFARDVVEVQQIRYSKLLNKITGNFDELQRQLKAELSRQYVQHQVALARDKVRREFEVIERVRENMQGMSLEKSFIGWKKWVWTKRRRLRRDARKQYKLATKGFLAAVESVRSAQVQIEMWEKQQDLYTDRIFYTHKLTGAVTFDTPGLEHYLPPNFAIPPPLPDSEFYSRSPEEMFQHSSSSSSASSTESLGEWQRRYGKDRRRLDKSMKKHEQQAKAQRDQLLAKHLAGKKGLGFTGVGDEAQTIVKLPPILGASSPSRPPSAPVDPSSFARLQSISKQARENNEGKIGEHEDPFAANFIKAVAWARQIMQSPEYIAYVNSSAFREKHTPNNNNTFTDTYNTFHNNEEVNNSQAVVNTFDGEVYHQTNVVRLWEDQHQDLLQIADKVKEKASDEYELAFKNIRKKRNQLNPDRHDLYMSHATRKPKSYEQVLIEKRGGLSKIDQIILNEQSSVNDDLVQIQEKDISKAGVANLLKPTEDELLKLAGGSIDMVYTGKEGFDLRTVLAQRAVHIKGKLKEKAMEDDPDIRRKYKKGFWAREFKPLFMWRYEGSSSEDEDEEDKRRKDKAEKRERRREEKEIKKKLEGLQLSQQESLRAANEEESQDGGSEKVRRSAKLGLKR